MSNRLVVCGSRFLIHDFTHTLLHSGVTCLPSNMYLCIICFPTYSMSYTHQVTYKREATGSYCERNCGSQVYHGDQSSSR